MRPAASPGRRAPLTCRLHQRRQWGRFGPRDPPSGRACVRATLAQPWVRPTCMVVAYTRVAGTHASLRFSLPPDHLFTTRYVVGDGGTPGMSTTRAVPTSCCLCLFALSVKCPLRNDSFRFTPGKRPRSVPQTLNSPRWLAEVKVKCRELSLLYEGLFSHFTNTNTT